jgi:hypothetical protein
VNVRKASPAFWMYRWALAGSFLFFCNDPFENERFAVVAKDIVAYVTFIVIETVANFLVHDASFFDS